MRYVPWILLSLLFALGYTANVPGDERASMLAPAGAPQPVSPLVVAQPTPPAWVRYADPTGISFEMPGDWLGEEVDPADLLLKFGEEVTSGIDHAAVLYTTEEFPVMEPGEGFVQVVTWSGGVDDGEPETIGFPRFLAPGSMPGFYVSWTRLNDASRALFYVSGIPYGDPTLPLLSDICCVALNAWVVNPGCRMEIAFAAPFVLDDARVEVGGREMAAIVAEHFPKFEHMVRSVEFPPPCNDAKPVLPTEWFTTTDALGITYALPAGYDVVESGVLQEEGVEGVEWEMRPMTVPVNTASALITVDARQSLEPDGAAPEIWYSENALVVMTSEDIPVEGASRARLTLYSYDPLLMAAISDGAYLNATLVATLSADGCGKTTALRSWIDLADIDYTNYTPLSALVAERAPLFDKILHGVTFPPECLESP